MLAVIPVTRSAPSTTTIAAPDREREQIEQHEHQDVAQDLLGYDAIAQLDRQDGARMQRALQLAQRVARHQDVAHDFGSAGGRPGAAADEHQQEQDHLRLVAPQLEVRRSQIRSS